MLQDSHVELSMQTARCLHAYQVDSFYDGDEPAPGECVVFSAMGAKKGRRTLKLTEARRHPEFREAIEKEMTSLINLGVLTMSSRGDLSEQLEGADYNESLRIAQCRSRLVKVDEGRQFLKARLVCQGFDEVVESHLDAPT